MLVVCVPMADGEASTQPGKRRREDAADDEESVLAASTSLLTTCSKTLTTAPLNTAKLETLPQHMLVQLLGHVVAERDAAVARGDAAEEQIKSRDDELKELKSIASRRYLIDPPCCNARVDMNVWDQRIEHVLSKWEPRTNGDGWTADSSHWSYSSVKKRLVYDAEQKCCIFDNYRQPKLNTHDLSTVMSSALLLYRVCCLFDGAFIGVTGWGGYKVVWSAEVKHKATGQALGFSEWKGAVMLRVSDMTAPAQFEADMLELLSVLFDPNCPHPYDGCVAGSVA